MNKKLTHKCHDCGCIEGQLHEPGCDMERCPSCGHQLISCGCTYLKDLSINLQDIVNRVPYIAYPVICMMCGALWPDFFDVPDKEWKSYIQIDMRNEVICRTCYDAIKEAIDTHSGANLTARYLMKHQIAKEGDIIYDVRTGRMK